MRPGELVALYGQRSARWVEAYLGVLEAGAAYVVLDPDHPPAHLARCLSRARPRALIEVAEVSGLPSELQREWARSGAGPHLHLTIDNPLTEGAGPLEPPALTISSEDLAYVSFTSGTTGTPKGVATSHGPPAHFLKWARATFDLNTDDRFSLLSGLSHDPILRDVLLPLSLGATLEIPGPADLLWPDRLVAWLLRRQVTVVHSTPAIARFLASAAPPAHPLPLRWVFFAGDVLHRDEVAALERLAPRVRCVNYYGATETPQAMSWFAVPPSAGSSADAESEPLPIGRGIDGVELLVLDPGQRPVGAGEDGEIWIRTHHLAKGYLDDEEATRERFRANPLTGDPRDRAYRTGDLGRRLENGDVLVLGRADRQVHIRGYRVELEEIEHLLRRYPGVGEAKVLALSNGRGDPLLAAGWTAKGPAPDAAELRSYLGAHLPGPSVPSSITHLPYLPLTPNGKLDRVALERSLRQSSNASRIAPRSPLEDWLSTLWRDILGCAAPGAHDDFFALGGHSLHATQVVSRIRDLTGLEVSPRTIFEHSTIARLASSLLELCSPTIRDFQIPVLERSPQGAHHPLSFAQQRLWFLDQLVPENPAYNLPIAFRLQGRLEIEALRLAVEGVTARHEALRTSFPARDGRATQEIAPATAMALPVVDLSSLSREDLSSEGAQWALEESRRGFDLARGPLLRVALARLSHRDHLLVLTVHHIVSDGWSQGAFCRELSLGYRRLLGSGEPAPAPLRIQYSDFARWQRRWLSGEILGAQLSHWRKHLAGAPERTRLPTDRARPESQSYRGALSRSTLPRDLTRSLRSGTARRGASLYMLLATAFSAWLARATGQLDLVIGCPIANRNRREIEGLIGFFVNMLPLRVELSRHATFDELLEQLRQTALDAYAHQDLPFEKLVDEVAPRRDLAYHPLVQITLALHNTPPAKLDLPGLRSDPVELDFEAVRFDLELHFRDLDGDLRADVVYATDLFEVTTIERWMSQLCLCLEALTEDVPQRWDEISLLSASERHQLLFEWNDTSVQWSETPSVLELFERHTRRAPDRIATVLEGHHMTYEALALRATQLSTSLAEHGVEPGACVGVAVERSPEMAASYLAVLAAEATLLPLDVDQPKSRLFEMLTDSGARWVLSTHPEALERPSWVQVVDGRNY